MISAKELGLNLTSSIWLGIKYDYIVFLTPSSKEKTKQFSIESLKEVKVYPTSIILSIEGEKMDYRFNTF